MTRTIVLIAGLIAWGSSNAVPVTIDFAGTMVSYRTANNSSFVEVIGSLSDLSITGSITYDTELGLSPVIATPSHYLQGGFSQPAEWISSSISWAAGTYVVPSLAGQTYFDRLDILDNSGLGGDQIQIHDLAYDLFDVTVPYNMHSLLIQLSGPGLISTGSPAASADAVPMMQNFSAPGFGRFESFHATSNGQLFTGYLGNFRIDAASIRPTQVPEPSTIALFGLGLIALGLVRQRCDATR